MSTQQDTTTETPLTPRQQRALALIEAGKVAFCPGDAFVTVTGSKGEHYQANRDSCTCPDFQRRGGPCKHQEAGRAIVTLYKLARAEAKRTGRVTLSPVLYKALANGTALLVERRRFLDAVAA